MAPVEISIPPGSAYVGIVRLAVGSLARGLGFDEERVDEIRIAVSEACTNAVLTHEEGGSDEPITVSWAEAPEQVIVEIGDRGGTPVESADAKDSQGFSTRMVMSVALLQELADDLTLGPRAGGGTTARLTFARS